MPTTSILSASLRLCGLLLLFTACCLPLTAQIKDFTRWVDPFIGTGGHGHTFPGAVMPFGMVQLSPDTRTDNWDGSSGYHYSDDIIYGFSHTHLSGTGIPDGCDILFMPMLGEPQFFAKAGDKAVNGYASRFSHANERAEPGYYSVKLDDDGILAEMTATQRVGFHRYAFPESDAANIVLDLRWRDKVSDSELNIVGRNRIEGYRRSSSWAKNQIVYFSGEFSKPFAKSQTGIGINTDKAEDFFILDNEITGTGSGKENIKASFRFKTRANEQILLKVGISSVSIEGARKNLAAELPGWDFDKVRADAKAAWNKELSKIEVSGGTDAQTKTFYTALYHTMIHPSIFNDVDGNYRGLDGKVHQLPGYLNRGDGETQRGDKSKGSASQRLGGEKPNQYTVFSLWDTFRAEHPLYTIIDQKRTVDFINTFIRMYEQGGRLPVWELWGEETDTMIGYHAVSVIADAMAKGIKGFDYEKAYEAAKHSAELDHFGLAAYKKRGYISQEDDKESVSKTLEYAYDDWCIAQMANVLHKTDDTFYYQKEADRYRQRSRSFENLFDPETGFMRPRVNGGFVKPFAPNEVTFNYTEGNAWVYSFFVPQDVLALIEINGGRENFAAKLDGLFTTNEKLSGREQPDITGLIGQYAHGNEPSHHIAYLYNYADQPWKTQKYVRNILDNFYKPTPDGLIGNEDCGQMSAWYVLSALGIYPVTPSDPTYQLGTPLFKEASINLENGKQFVIKAPNVSDKNYFVKSVNGTSSAWKTSISQDEIMSGGVLEFEMSSKPVPVPYRGGLVTLKRSHIFDEYCAVPVIGDGQRSFRGSYTFTIKSITPNARICYTVDGSEPGCKVTGPTEPITLPIDIIGRSFYYNRPITITEDTTVKAIAMNSKGVESQVAEARYHRLPSDWTVKIDSKYNRQYTGGGDEGLIDGIRGSANFASGEWQGYQAQDFVATIDLQRETEIKKVGGGFLQVARSWIWMPTHVEFEVSSDGVNFTRVADIKTDIAPTDMEPKIRDYVRNISPVRARYVRVHAYNLGKIPAWHPGAGDEAFIFVDEIVIQ